MCIATEEGEEEKKSPVSFTNYVTLLEGFNSGVFHIGVDVDIKGFGPERNSSQVFDFGGLCGRKEHRLTIFCHQLCFHVDSTIRENPNDFPHFVFETIV